MIRLAKVYDGVPGLDEALLALDYAEMFGESEHSVLSDIRNRMLLGVQHEGEWYVEAPPYYVDALERVNRQRLAGSAKEEKRRHDNENRHEEPKSRINCEEAKYYGQVLGLNGKVTFSDIKRKYRELVAQYHPDKVNHLGPKLRKVAEDEIKEINEAFHFFRDQQAKKVQQDD